MDWGVVANAIEVARKDCRVAGNELSHLCRLIHKLSLATLCYYNVTLDCSVTS